ncbi:MAG TPA: CopD family protein [Gaiellaceae bacterium]|nr:CopD family protein [Gaiellaceae bacterium]
MRGPLLLTASLAAAAALAPAALAHASVVETSPRDGAVLASAPSDVRVRFDDPVGVGPGNAVVANDGGSVLAGRPRLAQDGRVLVLRLRPGLADGDYSARWRIVSDDGHLEAGTIAFRVGTSGSGAGRPRSVLDAGGTGPPLHEEVSRWLYLGGILVAGGAALFGLLVSAAAPRRLSGTIVVGLVVAIVGGVSLLHATHADGTRFADVTKVAVVVAAVGATAAAIAATTPGALVVAQVVSLALLAAPPLAGHALDAGGPRALSLALDLLHTATAAFWAGGLLQLALGLRQGRDPEVARRFSRLALPAVAVLALSGGGRALRELTDVSQLWSTGYGRTILVKTGLFAALLGLAWLSRRRLGAPVRLRRSVAAELGLLAVVVGAVAVLTGLRPGRDAAVAAPTAPAGAREVGRAPAPPAGTVVLARQSRELAVALAVRPGRPLRLTATILGRTGRGVDGLDVELGAADEHPDTGIEVRKTASRRARSCGHGCYATTLPVPHPSRFTVRIDGIGAPRSAEFRLPGRWPPLPGAAFLGRATRAFRALDSAVFDERLTSGLGTVLHTRWTLAAPNRLSYSIRGGAGGIVIGTTRWDRAAPGAPWKASPTVLLPQPVPPWGSSVANARVLSQTPRRLTLSWLDPETPAWFTGTFDRRTALPVELRMTAAAHFMRDRFVAFDIVGIRIEPPPGARR